MYGRQGVLEQFVWKIHMVSGEENCASFPGMGRGSIFTKGNLSLCFYAERRAKSSSYSCFFSIVSAQNNQYAKVENLIVACPDLHTDYCLHK
jgi:hypothetical protein